MNSPSSCFDSSVKLTTRTSDCGSALSSPVSATNLSRSSNSTSSNSTSSPSIFSTIFLPVGLTVDAGAAAVTDVTVSPAAAAFMASNSALVGKRRGPFFSGATAVSLFLPAFIASNSALVGKRRGPFFSTFLAVFFAGVLATFFGALFFLLAFLGARDTAT